MISDRRLVPHGPEPEPEPGQYPGHAERLQRLATRPGGLHHTSVVYLAVQLGGPDLDDLSVHDRVHRALLPTTGIVPL
jgi:hypothetical protein